MRDGCWIESKIDTAEWETRMEALVGSNKKGGGGSGKKKS
jgi:hypothetical protein